MGKKIIINVIGADKEFIKNVQYRLDTFGYAVISCNPQKIQIIDVVGITNEN